MHWFSGRIKYNREVLRKQARTIGQFVDSHEVLVIAKVQHLNSCMLVAVRL